ncbi:MAG: universal stress protein [Candidatus Methanomethylophilaceae archaeon]|nr:universal stress protein [Candidatus Methanomethylophilaceae archaeon]
MDGEHITFNRILIPLDGSASSEVAIDIALHSAKDFSPRLQFVFVINPAALNKFGTVDYSQEYYTAKLEGEMILEHASKLAKEQGAEHEELLAEGVPWEILSELSKSSDMIIMSVSGKGGMRAGRIGSTTKKVIESSYCPVLTVKSRSRTLENILLPVYDENESAIDVAIQTAKRVGGKITVLSVEEKGHDPQPLVDKVVATIKAAGVEVAGEVGKGDPVDVIVGKSGLFDLIIVGVDRRGGLQSILHGGATERIVTMSSCPVTVVRKKRRLPCILRAQAAGSDPASTALSIFLNSLTASPIRQNAPNIWTATME